MNPYVLLAAAAACVGSFFYGQKVGADSCEAQAAREQHIAKVATDAVQKGAAKAIADMEIQNVTITQPIRTEVRTRTVYADCRHTPDGLRALNAAITGRAEPAGDGKLPRADAPASGR